MNKLCLLTVFVYSVSGLTHGEDRPGPNGGYIRMPGAFHTEVVADPNGSLRVYLLDMSWRNPLIKDSTVEMTFEGPTKLSAKCRPMRTHFKCSFDKPLKSSDRGQLIIRARRQGAPGNEALYDWPLSRSQSAKH